MRRGADQHRPAPSPTRGAAVTMTQLDARLVRALGLADAAAAFTAGAHAAGLAPPSRFGTEAVARLLGLRTNHPASQDALELLPSEPATRAEAAYSAAQILALQGLGDRSASRTRRPTFELPRSAPGSADPRHGRPLHRLPVRLGRHEREAARRPSASQAPGGFDCSGFVWRVYKLQAYPGGAALAATLSGRTTYAMSGEVPKAKRIGVRQAPAGRRHLLRRAGPKSKPARSTTRGSTSATAGSSTPRATASRSAPLTGWYRERFAWARRPLAEAGLIARPLAELTANGQITPSGDVTATASRIETTSASYQHPGEVQDAAVEPTARLLSSPSSCSSRSRSAAWLDGAPLQTSAGKPSHDARAGLPPTRVLARRARSCLPGFGVACGSRLSFAVTPHKSDDARSALAALLAASMLAERFPVPVEGVDAGGVSLSSSSSSRRPCCSAGRRACSSCASRRTFTQLLQHRPPIRVAYNASVFALAATAAGLLVAADTARRRRRPRRVGVAASAQYWVNLLLITRSSRSARGARSSRSCARTSAARSCPSR